MLGEGLGQWRAGSGNSGQKDAPAPSLPRTNMSGWVAGAATVDSGLGGAENAKGEKRDTALLDVRPQEGRARIRERAAAMEVGEGVFCPFRDVRSLPAPPPPVPHLP